MLRATGFAPELTRRPRRTIRPMTAAGRLSQAFTKTLKSSLAPSGSSGRKPSSSTTGGHARPIRQAPVWAPLVARLLEDRPRPSRTVAERGPPAPRRSRRGGRHVPRVGVLRDSAAADAEPSGYLRPRRAVGARRSHIVPGVRGHGASPVPPGRARQGIRPGRPCGGGPLPWSGRCGPRDRTARLSMPTVLKSR